MAKSSFAKERPVLIFLHLPKTGGTSLKNFLKSRYKPGSYCQMYWNGRSKLSGKEYMNKFIAMPREERDRFDLILGHFPYGLHRFLSRPCIYVTLLRNPLERFLSFYYQLTRAHHRAHEFRERNYSIEEYLRDWRIPGSGSAVAERFFSDMVFNALPGVDNELEWYYTEEAQDTQLIKRRLSDEFMLVGLTERLDDFLFLLCRRMGWRPWGLGHQNVNPGRLPAEQRLSSEQIDKINEMLGAEWEFYLHAEKIFQQKWKDLGMQERAWASCWSHANKSARIFSPVYRRAVQRMNR